MEKHLMATDEHGFTRIRKALLLIFLSVFIRVYPWPFLLVKL